MTCHHTFFLKDLSSAVCERISAEVGNDWRVKCGHCGMSVAESYGRKMLKQASYQYKQGMLSC